MKETGSGGYVWQVGAYTVKSPDNYQIDEIFDRLAYIIGN